MRLVILGCLAFYYFSLCSAQTSDLFDEANPTPFNEFDVSNPSELFAESVDLDPSSETLASTDIDDPPGSEIYGSSSADLFDETISSRPSDEILSSTSSTEIFDNESDLDFTPTIYDLGNDGPMNEWTLSGLIASSDLCSAENNQPDSDKLQRREQKKPTTCPPPSTDWKLRPLPRPYRRRLLPIKTDLRVCPVDLFSNRWFVFCDSGNPGDIIWDIWPDEYILYGATPYDHFSPCFTPKGVWCCGDYEQLTPDFPLKDLTIDAVATFVAKYFNFEIIPEFTARKCVRADMSRPSVGH